MARWGIWVLVFVLLGCAQESDRALKVATNQWLGSEPLFLARYLGVYQHNVDIVQLPSTSDVMRAMRNGNVDVVAATLDEALLLASRGEDLVVLLALDFSNGADVVLGRPPIASLEEIRARRIGVENTGLGAVMLSAALENAGMTVSDVELVSLPVEQHERAYLDNEVEAVVTFEPVATRLRNAGANLLFDSSAVPDLVVDVLLVHRTLLEQRTDALNDLVRGYYMARQFMLDKPAEAYNFIGKRMNMTSEELRQAYTGLRLPSLQDNIRWLAGSPSNFDATRDRLHALMTARHLLDHADVGHLPGAGQWLEQVAK